MSDETMDAEIQAEIEAEFAELTAEIARINALPQTAAPEKVAMLEALRAQWRGRERRAPEGDDRPEWRRSIDDAVSQAVDGLLADGLDVDLDGNIQFDLQGDTMKMHGQPVVDALIAGLQATLADRFPAIDAASRAGVDPGRMLMATLLGGLDQAVRDRTGRSEAPPEDQAAEDRPASKAAVKMNIDFSGLIGALLKPPAGGQPGSDDDGSAEAD